MLAGEVAAGLFPFPNIHACCPGLGEQRKQCEEAGPENGELLTGSLEG